MLRPHLQQIVDIEKKELKGIKGDLLERIQDGIDVDHSMHHGGTALERQFQRAKLNVINGLYDLLGVEYPSIEEFFEIREQLDQW